MVFNMNQLTVDEAARAVCHLVTSAATE